MYKPLCQDQVGLDSDYQKANYGLMLKRQDVVDHACKLYVFKLRDWMTINTEIRMLTVKIKRCSQNHYHVSIGLASSARANTPAASGAAAEVPLCERVHRPYRSVVATPVSGSRPPFENVDANVDEQLLNNTCPTEKR